MLIAGLAKSSLVDYPGLISAVIFLPGCNYNCFYCHNRQLIKGGEGFVSPKYIENFLLKRRDTLEGVVISGGEPTLATGLTPLIAQIKLLGYKVKLDTNGSNPHIIETLLNKGLVDYYAVDYKAPKEQYAQICGKEASGETALKTINLLKQKAADFEVRTTVYPQLTLEALITMAGELPTLPRWVLNNYRKPLNYLPKDEAKINQPPYTGVEINGFVKQIQKYQPNLKF